MKKYLSPVLLSLLFITLPFFAYAQGITGSGNGSAAGSGITGSGNNQTTSNSIPVTIGNPFKGGSDLPSIITTLLQNVIDPIAAVVVVIAIIWAGFKYVTAQGAPAKIKEANLALLYALIGTLVLLGATGIAAAVKGTVCGPLINC